MVLELITQSDQLEWRSTQNNKLVLIFMSKNIVTIQVVNLLMGQIVFLPVLYVDLLLFYLWLFNYYYNVIVEIEVFEIHITVNQVIFACVLFSRISRFSNVKICCSPKFVSQLQKLWFEKMRTFSTAES